ncbi:hypothetical protein GCM10022280_26670 [Sphingomonas swuensis]|uniref:SURF1-like protein n=1 Tax=Sphingomonas swuensis TaxID=977800 RepID=A0ABP7TD66_9SPHN
MTRLPILATLVVVAAVAAMVALGFWQLGRASEKEALLARYEANLRSAPLEVTDRVDLDSDLFRRARTICGGGPRPTRIEGAGKFGFRLLADCTAMDGGRTLVVQLGTTPRPATGARWNGGPVAGYLTPAPDKRSVLRRGFDHAVPDPMIVADPPLAGLSANPAPSLAEVPNNHRSYAFQWFAFAVSALIIYGLALRGRRKGRA